MIFAPASTKDANILKFSTNICSKQISDFKGIETTIAKSVSWKFKSARLNVLTALCIAERNWQWKEQLYLSQIAMRQTIDDQK